MAKVLISMREEFLDEIDEMAKTEHRSRSEFIREAVRQYISNKTKRVDFQALEAKAINRLLEGKPSV